jgi:hypothetical protein
MPAHRQRAVGAVAIQVHEARGRELLVQPADQVQRRRGSLDDDRSSQPPGQIAEQGQVLPGRGPPGPARHLGGERAEQLIRFGREHRQDEVADQRDTSGRLEAPGTERVDHLRGAQPGGDHGIEHRERPGQQFPQLRAGHVTDRERRTTGGTRQPQYPEELAHAQHVRVRVQDPRQHGRAAASRPHDEGERHGVHHVQRTSQAIVRNADTMTRWTAGPP